VRTGGPAVATDAASWADTLVYDLDPVTDDFPRVCTLSPLLFQLGVVALVSVQPRTGATGTGRPARGLAAADRGRRLTCRTVALGVGRRLGP
jgi:hypothetical protein